MKALSIDPEYTYYIFHGEKDVECRTWRTNHRGEILICATKVKVPGCISGHAYFTANLVDIVPFTKEHLDRAMMEEMPSGKCYAWLLEDIEPIYPIPVNGKLGLFDVDDSLIHYIADDIPDSMTDDEAAEFVNRVYDEQFTPLTYLPAQL